MNSSIQNLKESIDTIKYRSLFIFNLLSFVVNVLMISIVVFEFCTQEILSFTQFVQPRPHFFISTFSLFLLTFFNYNLLHRKDEFIHKVNLWVNLFVVLTTPLALYINVPEYPLVMSLGAGVFTITFPILFAGIFLRLKCLIVIIAIVFVGLTGLYMGNPPTIFDHTIPNELIVMLRGMTYIGLILTSGTMIIINIVMNKVNKTLPQTINDIEDADAEIVYLKKKEIAYKEIQKMAIPKSIKNGSVVNFMDAFPCGNTKILCLEAALNPSNGIAGGDFFDVYKSDKEMMFWVGDVEGHDIESAVIMSMIQTMINSVVKMYYSNPEHGKIKIDDLYRNINKLFYNECVRKFGRPYTVSLLLFKYCDDILTYVGQHEPFFVKNHKSKTTAVINHLDGIPFGIQEDVGDVESNHIDMKWTKSVVIVTDGVYECISKDTGEMLGYGGMKNIFEQSSILPVILDHLTLYTGGYFGDDTTILTLNIVDMVGNNNK